MRWAKVNEKRTDLKAVLRELAAEESADVGPHVGLKRLTAYRQGTLPAAEREALQEHLSLCSRCTALFRELREFETASSEAGPAGLQPLREEAWASLVRRLPRLSSKPPTIRAIAAGRQAPRARPAPRFLYAAAASVALAVAGLSVWAVVTARQEDGRLALLEQRLEAREESLGALRHSLAETERQLGVARGQIQRLEKERTERATVSSADRGQDARRVKELTARVGELSAALAELRQAARPELVAAATRPIELSIGPRFVLRGQRASELQGGGAVNPVAMAPQIGRATVTVNLTRHPPYGEYRFELLARQGEVLWSGHRSGKALLGDAGTSVSVSGIGPGLYRLRIEGLQKERTDFLGEYLLEVSFSSAPS
jgi:anti-sigma factor RsiW